MTRMRPDQVEPARILATGIDKISDRYILRAVLMEAIKASTGYISPHEVEYELKHVLNMMEE